MERVQFQQEQMLTELNDFEQKGIFSQDEIKHIMKKRTAFETTLIRRIPRKVDFMRYVAYEMGLETLRSKRVKRLKLKGPTSASDYALVRRQFQIFERALRKFPDDVGLWVQYIRTAHRARARALVSRICGRALSLHPNTPCLYILAAAHELKNLSPSAARVLLQRGLRLNGESVLLWREYVKMECGFVEGLRRRWGVLGIKIVEKERGKERVREDDGGDEGLMMEGLEEGEPAREERVRAGPDTDDEGTRNEILNGALVKTVISNAVKSRPTPDLFLSLHFVLSAYPCPPPYRLALLEHLFSLLFSFLLSQPSTSSSARSDSMAQVTRLYATRHLFPRPEGAAIVDAIQRTNEDLLELVRTRKADDAAKVYAEFVQEWFEKGLDENLNLYLLASLQNICSNLPLPSLLSSHLRLLRSPQNTNPPSSPKLLSLESRYSSKVPALVALS